MIDSFERILGELFIIRRGLDGNVRGQVRNDSRLVLPGDIFVAIPGSKTDGHKFIPTAIASGAQMVVHQNDLPHYDEKTTYLQVTDAGRAYSRLGRAFYDRPAQGLPLLRVTGTNGKTTTAFLVEHLFRHAGVPCGLISTVEYRDGKITAPAVNTTPEAGVLFPLLATMRKNGLKAAAMELSSHALAQGRASGAKFHTAIFTNLTGDHLDYHKDMEHYYEAKTLLFRELFAPDGTAVINVDDPYGLRLSNELGSRHVITFGESAAAEWRITNIELDETGSRFRLEHEDAAYEVASNLLGEHNIHNLAGAILAVRNYGLPDADIDHALQVPIRVPGRLEKFTAPNGVVFYVDYAHTDDALMHVLGVLRKITRGKLWAVFGAGGDRDRTKRPRMGKAAAQFADKIILTSDNPRSEDPQEIIAEIRAGIPSETIITIEADRRKAIRLAADRAKPGDVILIAGKGHENYQEIDGVRYHLDDREVLQDILTGK